jgi:hypothetical protein
MKIAKFVYEKEEKGQQVTKQYELVVLKETETYLEGISVQDMDPIQREEVIQIVKEFEQKLQPYMNKYRRMLKERIKQNIM